MERKITCIVCPKGCAMTVTGENGNLQVAGNTCPKGEEYAINECTNPVRTVTSTVRLSNRKDTMVSVKTENPVPKDQMFYVMAQIRATTLEAPVAIGDCVIDDICGTRIIATKEIR